MSNERPHVDIVVPIIRRDFVLPMLRSLRNCVPFPHKVIVVDQTQPNWEFTAKLWELADIVIKPHKNMGFAQASNIGLRICPSDYVAVCNDDTLFIQGYDWWAGIIETFEKFPKAAAVNPKSPKEPGWGWAEPGYRYLVPKDHPGRDLQALNKKDLQLQKDYLAARTKDPSADFSQYTDAMLEVREQLADLVYAATMRGPEYVEALTQEQNWAVTDAFACWCTVFRADRLEEIGLFDERFFPGGSEDYDLMFRIYYAKYRALSTSRSWVYHFWGKSKDSKDGFNTALPPAREPWNCLSTKGFGSEGLYDPDLDCWARSGVRTDPIVYQAPL